MTTTNDKIWFVDDEPSARFPVYSRGNAGEIVPGCTTPLAATLVGPTFQRVFHDLFAQTGAFSQSELDQPAATGAIFGGYLYLNASFLRVLAVRMPGLKVSDMDEMMLGRGPTLPYRRHPDDRSVSRSLKAMISIWRLMFGSDGHDLEGMRAETLQWIAALPSDPTDEELVARVAVFRERFVDGLAALIEGSMQAGLPGAMLERLTARAVKDDPGAMVQMLSGLGTVETARPAAELWKLGRLVPPSPGLSAAFDAGVAGLMSRLKSAEGDASVREFLARFDEFLSSYGHRGPNEVEPSADTWGTDPEIALAAVERLRLAPASADPAAAMQRLAIQRAEVTRRVRQRLFPPLRPVFDRLAASAIKGPPLRELAKGTIVLSLHAMRVGLFELADRLIARGAIPDRLSLFMVTIDELPGFVAEPASLADVLPERLARYRELDALVPPFSFDGTVPDVSTWVRRGDASGANKVTSGMVLEGIGVGSGIARGKARVITDPSDPSGIQPGEVLVAPLTDPAWTPLFLTAVAVVVDVGALLSHAAIVARELGMPAVVSVEGASTTIPDGTEIEVDGDRGTVRILG